MRRTKILICSSEVGAGKLGSSLGPDALRVSAVSIFYNLFDRLPTDEIKTKKINKYSPENKSAKYIKLIASTHQKICRKMAEAHRDGYNTLIFTGDHSNAAGFISGFREAYPDKKLGVIWIDAHGDIHSPYTSPSGNMHGMPIAILLGLDNKEKQIKKLKGDVIKNWEKLKRIGKSRIMPKLHPDEIIYISIRDLEEEEWETIHSHNIKYFSPADIKTKTIENVIEETKEYFKDYDGIYISFDADSLDPSISTGTGTPVPEGLSIEEAEKLLTAFTKMPNFKALEVTEVNPLLDRENRMAMAIIKILRDSLNI